MKAALIAGDETCFDRVYSGGRREIVESLCEVHPKFISRDAFESCIAELSEIEVIFSTWGMPCMTDAQIKRLPKLKAIFYAAGSVQSFIRPFLANGVKTFSAWAANAVPVAEFSLACIIFGMKQVYPCLSQRMIEGGGKPRPDIIGTYETTVGIISLGMIGRHVCELLKPFNVKVVAYDPFVSDEVFAKCNATRVELDKLFRISEVVSLHAPNLDSTKHMITGDHFRSMKTAATFVNTARGAIIDQAAMIQALRDRPDVNAHLDVVSPDPDFGLLDLPNVHFTPHLAGSMGNECRRLADYVIEEFKQWRDGKTTKYEVTEAMLKTMA